MKTGARTGWGYPFYRNLHVLNLLLLESHLRFRGRSKRRRERRGHFIGGFSQVWSFISADLMPWESGVVCRLVGGVWDIARIQVLMAGSTTGGSDYRHR